MLCVHIRFLFIQSCISDSRSCQQTPYPNNCIEYNQFTYVSLPYIKNWYKAYDSCHRMGATLAVLNTKQKTELLLDYMRAHPKLKSKDLLYVGLTNQRWISANSSTSFNIILCNIDLNQYKITCNMTLYVGYI